MYDASNKQHLNIEDMSPEQLFQIAHKLPHTQVLEIVNGIPTWLAKINFILHAGYDEFEGNTYDNGKSIDANFLKKGRSETIWIDANDNAQFVEHFIETFCFIITLGKPHWRKNSRKLIERSREAICVWERQKVPFQSLVETLYV